MVKQFKKHKFISMEKMAEILGCTEVCLWFNPTKLESRNHAQPDIDPFQHLAKTGYAQYAVTNIEEWYFDFHCMTVEYDTEGQKYIVQEFKEVHDKIQNVMQHLGYKDIAKKVKPIYKFKYKYSGEVVDCDITNISGTTETEMIGILVKY